MAGYLAGCAIFKDEGPYLAEWIEFHLLVGFDHLFVYDNRSEDDFAQVLAPYLADGVVTLIDWPEYPGGQLTAYDHCLRTQGGNWRWIAFIDLDEYVFSPELRPVPEILGRYEDLPAIGALWALFGTSGHLRRPSGLAIESYVQRFIGRRHPRQFKSIVDPSAVTRAYGPHSFAFRDPSWPSPVPRFAQWSELRVNHYLTRSEEEYRAKLATPDAFGKPRNVRKPEWVIGLPTVHDDAIAAYGPAVREALAKRRGAPLPGPSQGS